MAATRGSGVLDGGGQQQLSDQSLPHGGDQTVDDGPDIVHLELDLLYYDTVVAFLPDLAFRLSRVSDLHPVRLLLENAVQRGRLTSEYS